MTRLTWRLLFGPRIPAKAANRHARAGHAPGREYRQVPPVSPRMLGKRPRQGLVERPYRKPAGDMVEQRGVDRPVGAGDERQRKQHELGHRRGGIGVRDYRRDRHAQGAEARGTEHQRQHDRDPVRRERNPYSRPTTTMSAMSITL